MKTKVAEIFSIVLLFLILIGCSKDMERKNKMPILDVIAILDGLNVTIKGSAIDSDGKVLNTTIDWGDSKMNGLVGIDFSNIEISHRYIAPGTYSITIIANDDTGDIVTQSIIVTVDFKETSLAGIKANMFKSAENELLILTINLHTYQELQQNEKFNLIVDVIGKMDIDFIAFQECAQNKSSEIVNGIIRKDNMAHIISNRLKEKYSADYNYIWNWAHYGWTVWEEGVSILSKHPLMDSYDKYISSSTSTSNITSRKVIYGSYETTVGRINIFSVHTHWRTSLTDEEQNNQIKNVKLMVDEKASLADAVSFVCGDFNVNPTSEYPWSEGYNMMRINSEYLDSFLEIYPDANTKPPLSIYYTIGGDLPGRIDYIFMKNNAQFTVVDSQIIFKDDVVGRVSDHYGVLTKVRYTK